MKKINSSDRWPVPSPSNYSDLGKSPFHDIRRAALKLGMPSVCSLFLHDVPSVLLFGECFGTLRWCSLPYSPFSRVVVQPTFCNIPPCIAVSSCYQGMVQLPTCNALGLEMNWTLPGRAPDFFRSNFLSEEVGLPLAPFSPNRAIFSMPCRLLSSHLYEIIDWETR